MLFDYKKNNYIEIIYGHIYIKLVFRFLGTRLSILNKNCLEKILNNIKKINFGKMSLL